MERDRQPDDDAERRRQQADAEPKQPSRPNAPQQVRDYEQLHDTHARVAVESEKRAAPVPHDHAAEARKRVHEQTHRDQHGVLGAEVEPHRPRQLDRPALEAAAAKRAAHEQEEARRAALRENLKPAEEKYQDAMRKLEAPDPALERQQKEIARIQRDQSDERDRLGELQRLEIQQLKDAGKLEFLQDVHEDERLCLDRQHAAQRQAVKFERDAAAIYNHDDVAYAAAVAAAQAAIVEQQQWQESHQLLRQEATAWRDNTDKNFEITERQQRHQRIMEGRPLNTENTERATSRERNSIQRHEGGRDR